MKQKPEGKQAPPAKGGKSRVTEDARRLQLNARNRRSKLKARTVTGPQVWCGSRSGNRSDHDSAKCGRCGPRTTYFRLGQIVYVGGKRTTAGEALRAS